MTISSETNRSGPYSCNGATTSFAYGFKVYDEAHLSVILTNSAGTETTLTLGTHYTVTGVGADAGGSVVTVATYATGYKITILLDVPFEQETDLENQGAYYAETIERALDLQTQMSLQLKEQISRAVVLPVSETETVTISAAVLNDVANNAPLVAQYKDEAAASAAAAAASAAAAALFDPDNFYTKTAADDLLAAKVPTARTLTASAALTIGGVAGETADLSANRSLGLSFAPQADAEAGTATDKALNALGVAQAIKAQALKLGIPTELNGLTEAEYAVPAGAKRLTAMVMTASLAAAGKIRLQLGTSAGYVTSGYANPGAVISGSTSYLAYVVTENGIDFNETSSAGTGKVGIINLYHFGGNTWMYEVIMTEGSRYNHFMGFIALPGELDKIKIANSGSTTFDAGWANVMEG